MNELHPISLSYVVYKLVMKVLTNRLKPLLPQIISDTQSIFTLGRSIIDNILVAYKVFYHMRGNASSLGSMEIKLDMSKAYDRVECDFLRRVKMKLWFQVDCISLVMKCVRTTSFSFLVNGVPKGHILHSLGLHKGDCISPYLFIFCMEGLSSLLRCKVKRGALHGIRIYREMAFISYLLFADGTMIFCEATEEGISMLKKVLVKYESASCQKVKFNKTEVSFSKGVKAEKRCCIMNVWILRRC